MAHPGAVVSEMSASRDEGIKQGHGKALWCRPLCWLAVISGFSPGIQTIKSVMDINHLRKLGGSSPLGQLGVSLIELMIVLGILGVVAGVSIPLAGGFLTPTLERSYSTDRERIQGAVDAYYSAQHNDRFMGKHQYPLLGREQTDETLTTQQTIALSDIVDDGSPFDPVNGTVTTALWNPRGGTQGEDISAAWNDGVDVGLRSIGASGSGSQDTWSTMSVSRDGITYYTDPRYYFIDFEELVRREFLRSIPDSASPDHKPPSSTETYTGSYTWYVDGSGNVQSLYHFFPSNTGYLDGVFP